MGTEAAVLARFIARIQNTRTRITAFYRKDKNASFVSTEIVVNKSTVWT